jgi:hypothetical protein
MSETMNDSLTNYERVELNRKRLYDIEDSLKALRDEVGELTKKQINDSIRHIQSLDDSLMAIDKALTQENLGSVKS